MDGLAWAKEKFLNEVLCKFFRYMITVAEKNEARQPQKIVDLSIKNMNQVLKMVDADKKGVFVATFVNMILLPMWDKEKAWIDAAKLKEFVRKTYEEQYKAAQSLDPSLGIDMVPFDEFCDEPFFEEHMAKVGEYFSCLAEVHLS
jgi:hypothetical protein